MHVVPERVNHLNDPALHRLRWQRYTERQRREEHFASHKAKSESHHRGGGALQVEKCFSGYSCFSVSRLLDVSEHIVNTFL